ncbi:hypothetical protein L1887_03714 [Cichorium endivia]|nr:hypothetical protein L1887_03714 [Cichorium endivia]
MSVKVQEFWMQLRPVSIFGVNFTVCFLSCVMKTAFIAAEGSYVQLWVRIGELYEISGRGRDIRDRVMINVPLSKSESISRPSMSASGYRFQTSLVSKHRFPAMHQMGLVNSLAPNLFSCNEEYARHMSIHDVVKKDFYEHVLAGSSMTAREYV